MQKVRKNKKNIGIILFVILNFFIFSQKAYTQEVEVYAGKTNLALNEKFTLTILFPKDHKREFKAYHNYFFPDITDFTKGKTLYTEEEDPRAYKIVQYYSPRKAGTFHVNALKIKIKDKLYSSSRVTVTVSGKNNPKAESIPETKDEDDLEFDEPKLEAHFLIQPSKTIVYVGEGFGISLSFLISIQNKAELTFIDLEEQRKEFITKLKSTGSMVEDFPFSNSILLDTVVYKDKKYLSWKLYEGVFFPTDSNNVRIPSLQFSVLTYALAKNKNESMERKPLVKRFTTKPFVIKVSSMPSASRKEHVPVGYFRLVEDASPYKFQTGKSFKYTFTIIGEGNIATLPEPAVLASEYFDVYAPRVSQEIFRYQGKVTGSKTFVYYVTPKEPGDFQLSDFFSWPYFNTATRKPDTLRSGLSLKVRGESLKNNYISVNNPGDFYNRIHTDSNQLRLLAKDSRLKFWTNLSIIVMLVITVVLVIKK